MFQVLGLGERAEEAYHALLEVASATESEIADRLGLSHADAVTALSELDGLGLVARSGTSDDHYVASPPGVALATLLMQRREDLRRAEIHLADLAEAYGRSGRRRAAEVVDVVHGHAAVAQRFLQLHAMAKAEILSLTKADVLAVPGEENTHETAAAERGVQVKAVIERASLARPGVVDGAVAALGGGENVRVLSDVPIRLLVVDRELALVPLASETVPGVDALMVHRSGLLDALIALFEEVWQRATPLLLSRGSMLETQVTGLTEMDTRIFALLLAGLTDRAAANQLGTSLRTVQRRVKFLMNAVGAETRLQLGFHAARNGWDKPLTARAVTDDHSDDPTRGLIG